MIEAPTSWTEDVGAWIGVIADPDRGVDRFLEPLRPSEGLSVLEAGPHAVIHALRRTSRAGKVYAVSSRKDATPAAASANLIRLEFDGEGIPLRDASVDVAVARASLIGVWGLELERLLEEFQRIARPSGLMAGVWISSADGDLGRLLGAHPSRAAYPELETSWARVFERHGFTAEAVDAPWRAPGRSILKRVLQAELGGEADIEVGSAELSSACRVFWKLREG